MFRRKTIQLVIWLFATSLTAHAQRIGINNNALFDAVGALSAGVEVPLSGSTSVEAYGSIRPWKRGDYSVHKYWLVQGQFRIWPCQVMNGFFYGPYIHAGEFNLGNQEMVFGLLKGLKPHRYEGWLAGGGIGIGYEYALAKHWNVGAEVGAGYTYINYRKYNCEVCGSKKDDDVYHYVGISRLGLSVIYVF